MKIGDIQPIERKKNLSIRVANQLEQMIRKGEIEIGDKLPAERILCETFAVSRTVIREAVSFLTAKGLLSAQAGNGTYIKGVGSSEVADYMGLHITLKNIPENFDQFIEVRKVLEINIAQIAAEKCDDEIIHLLEQNLCDLRNLVGKPEQFAKKDLEFHMLLARATKNPLFEIMLKPLIKSLLDVIRLALMYDEASIEAIHFHSEILEAIRNHQVDEAGLKMKNHLNQTCNAVRAAIEKLNY